jgi:RNA polymerase sigma-B factor
LTGADDGSAALLERYARERDAVVREELVRRFMPLARHLARRYRGREDVDDLEQIASLGLLKAIERFDPAVGVAFSSFAVPTILGELRRYFRDHAWSVRVPRSVQELTLRIDRMTEELTARLGRPPTPAELASACDASVEQVLEALATATAHHAISLDRPRSEDGEHTLADVGGADDPAYARVEEAAYVAQLLAVLPERERLILRLRFQEERTQAEIGALIGVSQMQVSRLLRRAILGLQAVADAGP